MRLAVLGAGRIGAAHTRTLATLAIDELLVADVDVQRAELVAAQHDATPMALDAAFDARPDALVITAPTTTHPELIRRAAEAGIPAFCEKPVAPDLRQTIAVVRDLAGSEVPIQIGFQRRFDPGYRRARQDLADGAIGELRRAHLTTCDPAPPPESFIATSGGIYRDCHVHDFDILRWVTGREVVSVTTFGANRGAAYFGELGDVDESVGVVALDDGTLATFQGSRYNGQGYDVRMELAGTLGQRTVGLDERVPLVSAEQGATFPDGDPWRGFAERFAQAYRAELTAFVEVAAGRLANPCTPADVLESLYVSEAADLSFREGRTVTIAEARDR